MARHSVLCYAPRMPLRRSVLFVVAVLLMGGLAGAQTVSTDPPAIAAVRVKAQAGDANAHFDLGCAPDDGKGVPHDAVESLKRRNRAASPASTRC